MNEIKILGTEEIDGTTFTGIEGGFGEGKRSMLVRDIAEATETTTKKLNQNIDRNRKRFADGVDIIDLEKNSEVTHSDLKEMGFSQQAINRSSNIYLLSERGYAKLLKIMDSDEAWEQYDKFVDGYFQYREAVREAKPMTIQDQIALLATGNTKLNETVDEMVEEVHELKESFGLPAPQAKRLEKVRKKQVVTLLGGFDSNAYRELSGKAFSEIGRDFKDRFDLPRYDALPMSRFDEAVEYLKHWQLPTNLGLSVRELNAQTELEV